jgi:hypothetical protein
MSAASQESWKALPPPTLKEPLHFEALYTDADAEKMMLGLVPREMEDKWFIYFLGGWLYFHRSWTGACIYAVRLDGSPAGVRVIDSWVNRDPQQYKNADLEYDRKLVAFLIDAFLLGRPAQFPRPSDLPQPKPGVFQHSVVGRAYPEVDHRTSSGDGFWRRLLRRFKKRKNGYSLGIVASLLLALYAAYATAYFAWLTATPLSAARLKRVQYDAYVWFAILCFALIAIAVLAFRTWSRRKK